MKTLLNKLIVALIVLAPIACSNPYPAPIMQPQFRTSESLAEGSKNAKVDGFMIQLTNFRKTTYFKANFESQWLPRIPFNTTTNYTFSEANMRASEFSSSAGISVSTLKAAMISFSADLRQAISINNSLSQMITKTITLKAKQQVRYRVGTNVQRFEGTIKPIPGLYIPNPNISWEVPVGSQFVDFQFR
jgi:hypothetical protein